MIYLKDKQTNEIKTFEVDNYLQLSKNIRDQYIEATQVEIDEFNLNEAKNKKIAELEVFHESDEVRILTINNTFKVSTNYETSRQYFSELVNKNINKVAALNDLQRLQGEEQTHTTDNVIVNWLLNGQSIEVPVTILRIAQYKVGEIVDNNYLQYESHKRAIQSLTTKTKVKNYDFKKGYLLNNKLNFDT
jgi:hypothetical protein